MQAKKRVKQNRKARAASRVSQIKNKLNSGDSRAHVNSFLEKYIQCEIAAKEMVVGYESAKGQDMLYKDVTMDLRVLRGAFNHYGLNLSDGVAQRLFAGKVSKGKRRSAKMLRNSLIHSMTKKNISELDSCYEQIIADMSEFLEAVCD